MIDRDEEPNSYLLFFGIEPSIRNWSQQELASNSSRGRGDSRNWNSTSALPRENRREERDVGLTRERWIERGLDFFMN